ncbi:cellulase (glycosyl hydrolase family 5) [Kribbella voronezhensis]|uniref:Cellulase (Glycosyl hydrolase family 5) n=1 Tax=Kribbella voronezhensis TaxID=2512212 RepID=A0A4R7T672_9ACTN|nr:cellulase family glycosylhydrolase [Kribbella voronezhensis]TDU87195.1 cellulase (glycosyl hydrolase family 5) [Kribbella voronezhensis]
MNNPDSPAFGVNYVPREQWWNAWLDFDEASIADDLAAIAALGCDHVRIQCLWPVFQPFPTSVSATAMARLSTVLDRAHAAGLDVWVTVLNGFLSGWVFRPAWMHDRNVFTDPLAISAATTLLGAVAEVVAGHPAGAGVDLGNEPNMLAGFEREPVTGSDLDAWARSMIAAVRSAAPGLPVVLGADHQPWMTAKTGFGRPLLANELDVTTVHAWPYFSGFLGRFGEDHDVSWAIGAYLARIAAAYQSQPRPIWVQEIGVAPEWVANVAVEDAAEQLIRGALSAPGVAGLSWWASHDIRPDHTGFNSIEYDLGLLDVHNRVKPVGQRFAETIADLRRTRPAAPEVTEVVLSRDAIADLHFADRWARGWVAGAPPRVILASGD